MSVLIYEKKERIAYITLNRPEKMNAVNSEIIDELAKTWVDFRDDDGLWVAVITGAGKAFCAGADFQSLSQPGVQEEFKVARENPNQYMVWKPIIGAINGHAIGRGLSIALSCDIRIASEAAKFSMPEVRFNVMPQCVDILEHFLPPAIARELLLTGDSISAQRAYEIGLVNKVVPPEQVLSEATAMAERLCKNPPLAVSAMKELLSRSRDLNYQTGAALYQNANTRLRSSEDFAEGIKAFSDKREPKWQGR